MDTEITIAYNIEELTVLKERSEAEARLSYTLYEDTVQLIENLIEKNCALDDILIYEHIAKVHFTIASAYDKLASSYNQSILDLRELY